jgi:hypothetical protein
MGLSAREKARLCMNVYSITDEKVEDIANIGMRLILEELYNLEKITEDDFKRFDANYTVIYKKPSKISTFWTKFMKKEDDKVRHLILVEQKSLEDREII